MAAISRTPALSVIIKIFGPNNPCWIQTTKGLLTFPPSVLQRMSAPRKTQPRPPGLAKDFGLQSTWTGSSLQSWENRFRQSKACQAPVGKSLDPTGYFFDSGNIQGLWSGWPSIWRRNAPGGHWVITQWCWWWFPHDATCTGWKCQEERETCALVLMHTSKHLGLVSVCFWGLRKGSFLVPVSFGFKVVFFTCVLGFFRLVLV